MISIYSAYPPFCAKLRTKIQQIFGIYKDLAVKIKYIWIFNGKSLVLAQLCERNFGGEALEAHRGMSGGHFKE